MQIYDYRLQNIQYQCHNNILIITFTIHKCNTKCTSQIEKEIILVSISTKYEEKANLNIRFHTKATNIISNSELRVVIQRYQRLVVNTFLLAVLQYYNDIINTKLIKAVIIVMVIIIMIIIITTIVISIIIILVIINMNMNTNMNILL